VTGCPLYPYTDPVVEVSEQARVIAGRYQLQSLIGEGGMASVYRARDNTLERPVAVKVLFARDERDKTRLVQQFLREARIAASVHHRNVIQIVDFGTTEEQQPFMVMELLEGESLGQRMHRDPPLPLVETVQIASLTLRGLAAVHDGGIIHRDLKPDNIFLTRDRQGALFPKILDFGISRSIEPRSGRRSALTTRDGMIVGTPEYMSPEQARGVRSIDKRTDIYSMGCILYEALTGELPFECENVGDLIIQIVTGTAPRVHDRNPAVPQAISDVVARAMARAPDDRFQDAMEMQQALLAATETLAEAPLLKMLSDAPPMFEPSVTPRVSSDRLRTLEFDLLSEVAKPTAPEATVAEPAQVQLPARGASRAARVRGAVFALAAFCTAAGVVLWQRGGQPNAAPAGTARALAAAPVAEPPAPARSTITVQLRNVPETASVSVDGIPAAGTTLELPLDRGNRVIKVTAQGKAPWQVVHHASSDASYDVWLADMEPAAVREASTASPRRAAASTSTRRKVHKKPPSALRKLDF
jgi:serine/threonine protein kinase